VSPGKGPSEKDISQDEDEDGAKVHHGFGLSGILAVFER